jgi:hypothetical protein
MQISTLGTPPSHHLSRITPTEAQITAEFSNLTRGTIDADARNPRKRGLSANGSQAE